MVNDPRHHGQAQAQGGGNDPRSREGMLECTRSRFFGHRSGTRTATSDELRRSLSLSLPSTLTPDPTPGIITCAEITAMIATIAATARE